MQRSIERNVFDASGMPSGARSAALFRMNIAVGSDMRNPVTDALIGSLRRRGHEVELFGALREASDDNWPSVGTDVGNHVASGKSDQGIVCCWTGTGVSIAANKVAGVRAASCADAQTAAGAREWNDANILALSLRTTSEAVMEEILDAWFAAEKTKDAKYVSMISQIS